MKGLENLTEYAEKLDGEILRGYSKITKKWEDKGKSKYYLSCLCDVVCIPTGSLNFSVIPEIGILSTFPNAASILNSMLGIRDGKHPIGIREENGKFIIDNKYFYYLDSLAKTIRTPELIVGIGFAGKGIFNLYNYFTNNDSSSLSEGLGDLNLGIFLVSNASAWFIRNSDPKMLDKKPLWKTICENVFLPQPELIPIPIKVNYLDN